jgi:hypothetical protein
MGEVMQLFDKAESGRTIILRLDQGDYLLESICEAIKKAGISDGYVVSGIGTLDYCVLHMVMTTSYPAVEYFKKWDDKPLELASIDGVIADGIPHLHAVVSDKDTAVAGHVEPGCRILYLGEIVIQELKGQALERVKNAKGINELVEKG